MAHSRSFLANQKARNAIVGAENLLNGHNMMTTEKENTFFLNIQKLIYCRFKGAVE